MDKKKIDLFITITFFVAIVAGSAFLFSEDAIPPELLLSATTPTPTSLLGLYEPTPVARNYVEPVAEEAPGLVDGWTIFFAIAVLGGVGILVTVMKVSKATAKKRLAAPATVQPDFDDLALVDEPAAPEPRPAATTTAGRLTQQPLSFFPQDIYEVVNGVLLSRGGQGAEGPNYWIEKERCIVNPLAWALGFDYRAGCDPANVQKYLIDLQSRLCKAGYDTNVRIDARRCVVEVENPAPPVFRLRQYWPDIVRAPSDRSCVPGVEAVNGAIMPKRLTMKGERAGTMIAGRTGSGKTQVVLSSILTACALTSPAKLALIIGDMKGDCKPLDGLPHLASPVLTDVEDIANMLIAAVAEMASRQRRAARGDRSFNGKAIWIVLDEVAGTLLSAGDRSKEMIAAVQQLTMVGRGLGFMVTMATQRIYDLPGGDIYSNCGRRFGLKLNTGNDSFALTGAQGTRLHDLRGRGAFEVFDAGNADGERGQGFFVADPEEEGYTEELQWYVGEVSAQWAGIWTHYRLELPEPDDYEPEAPRPVKRSWQDDDGWDNESGEEWAPAGVEPSAMSDKVEAHAERILGAYRPDELFDGDDLKYGIMSKCVRLIFGPDAKAAGSNWDDVSAALLFIRQWRDVAIEETSTST